MELFPAQPDLSLQISPSNTTPASGWRRHDENMELGFWRRSLDSTNNSNNKSSTIPCTAKADDTTFDLSLGIPSATVSSNTRDSLPLRSLYPHHHFHYHHHHPLPQEGYHSELSLLKPIRGIPIYQNPPSSFPLDPPHQPQHMYDSSSTSSFTPFATTPGMSRSRYSPSRFPAKRVMRSPRMRWTTTLHARFVHAVELLGGHESMFCFSFCCVNYLLFWDMETIQRGEQIFTFLLCLCSILGVQEPHPSLFWSSWM